MTVQVNLTWIGMFIMAANILFLVFRLTQPYLTNLLSSFRSTQPKLTNILSSFRSSQPKWVDSPSQHTLILMETTHLKYNLVFINLTWLLGVQMDNKFLRGSHSLKILNIMLSASMANDRGEPAVSYRWTSWGWENNRLKFKTAGILAII